MTLDDRLDTGASDTYASCTDSIRTPKAAELEGRRFVNALKLSGLPHHKGLDESSRLDAALKHSAG